MKVGDIIGADCIRSVRSRLRLAPKHYDALIGKRLRRGWRQYGNRLGLRGRVGKVSGSLLAVFEAT